MSYRGVMAVLVLGALAVMPVRAEGDHQEAEGAMDSAGADESMRGMGRMMMPMGRRGGRQGGHEMDPAMKEKRETLRAAEEKVRGLAKSLRKAKEPEKAALKTQARAALGELFDARLAMEQAMTDKMAEHLAEKKAKLAKKKAAKERLINERLEKLSGDAPDWDD